MAAGKTLAVRLFVSVVQFNCGDVRIIVAADACVDLGGKAAASCAFGVVRGRAATRINLPMMLSRCVSTPYVGC